MNKKYFWAFFILMAIYITLAFTLPTDPEILKKHEITQGEARLLNLTIITPISLVYFAALYGFLRFRSYAKNVIKTKEGRPLMDISTGLMILAFGLPVASILGSLLSYFKFQHEDIIVASTIVRNYVGLLIALAAFMHIARGAAGLAETLKNKKLPTSRPTLSLIGTIVSASLFTWLITVHPEGGGKPESIYYMPSLLVILTLVAPYVYTWCIATKAVRNLYFYKNNVRGFVYKRAIDYIAKGIFVITLISIFAQLLTTLSEQFNRLNLTPLLLVIYLLVALYVLGYGLVAQGAKKLKQIEEV